MNFTVRASTYSSLKLHICYINSHSLSTQLLITAQAKNQRYYAQPSLADKHSYIDELPLRKKKSHPIKKHDAFNNSNIQHKSVYFQKEKILVHDKSKKFYEAIELFQLYARSLRTEPAWSVFKDLLQMISVDPRLNLPLNYHITMSKLLNLRYIRKYNSATINEFEQMLDSLHKYIFSSLFQDHSYSSKEINDRDLEKSCQNDIFAESKAASPHSKFLSIALDNTEDILEPSSQRSISHSQKTKIQQPIFTVLTNNILGFCAASQQSKKAMEIWADAKASGIVLDSNSYKLYLSVLVKAMDVAEPDLMYFRHINNTWNEMTEKKIPQNLYVCSLMIKAYGYAGELVSAQKMFKDVLTQQNNYSSSTDTPLFSYIKSFSSFLDHFKQQNESVGYNCSPGSPNSNPFSFNYTESRHIDVYNALIEAHCYQRDFDGATKVFDSLQSLQKLGQLDGLGLNRKLFDTSFRSRGFGLGHGLSQSILYPKLGSAPPPNLRTFNIFVRYLAIHRMYRQIGTIINLMVSLNIKPSIRTWKYAITRSFIRNDPRLAIELGTLIELHIRSPEQIPRIRNFMATARRNIELRNEDLEHQVAINPAGELPNHNHSLEQEQSYGYEQEQERGDLEQPAQFISPVLSRV